jgi:hypothetical protein
MQKKECSEKPAKVVLAQRLLYLVVSLGIIRTTITVMRHADVRSPYFLIFVKFLVYTVSIFMIYQSGKANNWARWSLLLIFTISIPLVILPSLESISHNLVYALFVFLQLTMYIVALVFLFHKSSSSWFGREKVSKDQLR